MAAIFVAILIFGGISLVKASSDELTGSDGLGKPITTILSEAKTKLGVSLDQAETGPVINFFEDGTDFSEDDIILVAKEAITLTTVSGNDATAFVRATTVNGVATTAVEHETGTVVRNLEQAVQIVFENGDYVMQAGDKIVVSIPEKFGNFETLTPADISVSSDGNATFATNELINSSSLVQTVVATLDGEATNADEKITITIGDTNKLLFPVTLGSYSFHISVKNSDDEVIETGCAILEWGNEVGITTFVRVAPPRNVQVNYAGEVSWTASPHAESHSVDMYVVYYKPSTETEYSSCPPTTEESAAGKGCKVFPLNHSSPDSVDPNAEFGTIIIGLPTGQYDFLMRSMGFDTVESRTDCRLDYGCEVLGVDISEMFVEVDLTVLARPEKRYLSEGDNYGTEAKLLMYDPIGNRITSTETIVLDDTGTFHKSDVQMLKGTGFETYLKGRSHLAKKLTGINVDEGSVLEFNFTEGSSGEFGLFRLLAGDVQGVWPGLKDNFVDILDVSAVDARFNQTTDVDADLNKDGIVDVLDMSTVLSNFNTAGEPIPSS